MENNVKKVFAKKRRPSPMAVYHFIYFFFISILWDNDSYIFAVVAARGVRKFLFSVHFYRCNCISMTGCYFSKNIAATEIFCKSLLIGFKVVAKSNRPMAGDCKNYIRPMRKRYKKKCPPHGLLHRPHAPSKYCPVPKMNPAFLN